MKPSTRLRLILLVILILIVLAIPVGSIGVARQSLPPLSGQLKVKGLQAPVRVIRDRQGVPHIYAANIHDLFLAQGYVTAQDRLWQMLTRRQAAHGQMRQWLGDQAAGIDSGLPSADWLAQAQAAAPTLDAETQTALQAFALGINDCLADCRLPPEMTVLRPQPRTSIPPWTEIDSLALAQMAAWGQAQQADVNLRAEIESRAGILSPDLWASGEVISHPVPGLAPDIRFLARATGLSYQAEGDAELALSEPALPAPWYMVTLHAPGIDVAGASWPGLPGVALDKPDANQPPGRHPAMLSLTQAQLVTRLLALQPEGWLQVRVQGMLRQWQESAAREMPPSFDNPSSAVYEAWVWHLARDTFQSKIGVDLFRRYWLTGQAPGALARLAAQPDNLWWDDPATPQQEGRDAIMQRALAEALDYMGRHYGDLHTIWAWDEMHTAAFRHPLSPRGPAGWDSPLGWLMDRDVHVKGDGAAPDYASCDPSSFVDPQATCPPLAVRSIWIGSSGMGASVFTLAGGQSGNPFSAHYADLLPLWARGESSILLNMPDPQALPSSSIEGRLVLIP